MFIFIILLLIILTFLNEIYLVKPALFIKKRHTSAVMIHCLAILLIFITLFIIFHRIIFSATLTLGIHFLMTAINNAKYKALKEGLVFSDIVMFSQAFKFPRLYFPFINSLLLIIFPLAIFVMLAIDLRIESTLYLKNVLIDTILCLIVNSGLFISINYLAKRQTLSLNPYTDLQTLGLLSSVIIGTIKARQKNHRHAFTEQLTKTHFSNLPHSTFEKLPHDIIVVQSESFFDIRRLYAAISPDILKNYDVIKGKSQFYGTLNVPAWGANTMRTEFAFLSGLKDMEIGLFRYYPYHYIQGEVFSIAAYLKQQGYRTICIHPFSANFFERQRVFPLLGFDEFIDIHSFIREKTSGSYRSDLSVARKIVEIQENSDEALFIFAITMENHGPLHLENITAEDEAMVYQTQPDFDSHDLTAYLRHLKNADAMMAYLILHFKQSKKPSCLCFYGDHVPSIPAAYQALQFENSQTDYFIWQSNCEKQNSDFHPINANQLGLLLIQSTLLTKI